MKNDVARSKVYFNYSFELPNASLETYFKSVVNGQSEVYDTPFAKGESTKHMLSAWMKVLESIGPEWPSLLEFEKDLANKVGPMSVRLPLKQRMSDIDSYYDGILLPSTKISPAATDAVVKEFASLRGLELRGQKSTLEHMKLSTNSGSPYFTKRRNVIPTNSVKVMPWGDGTVTQSLHDPNVQDYNAAAILGWRGQEGGPKKTDVKQRVVWMFPLAVNIAELQVYQPFIEAAQKYGLVPAWISNESVDERVTKLFDSKAENDLVVCTDFSKFDQHFNPDCQDAAWTILAHLLSAIQIHKKEVDPMVLEIPAGPMAICQGFWYYPIKGSGTKYLYVGFPGDDNIEYVYVPEMLLDERGHNTMVCHAKYLNPHVETVYDGLPKDNLFYVGVFEEERRMKDTEGKPNNPVDGGSWSVHLTSWGTKDEANFTYGNVVEFRGRIQRRFSYTQWKRDERGRWNISIIESSSSEWEDKDPKDYGPWAAPTGHVGSIRHTDAKAVYDVHIGKLVSYEPHTFPTPRSFFRFSEPEVVEGKVGWSKPVKHAFLEAHIDAMSRFPKQADNDIANGIEVGKMIASALLGNEDDAIEYFTKAVALPLAAKARDVKASAKALGDLWMSYRYVYGTTKMDVKERIDYLAREAFYNNVCPKCYGEAQLTTLDTDAQVRHSFRALPNEADLMSTIKRRMYEGGIMPSLYKGWDLVPFSFVADWFGDVGNYLEGLEAIHHGQEYIYNESCYSLRYTVDAEVWGVPQKLELYTRVYELPPLDDSLWKYFDFSYKSNRGPTVKTKLKRVGDVGALSLSFI